MARSRGNPLARAVLGVLAVLVVALALSTAYARFRPTTRFRTDTTTHARPIRVQVLNGSGESGIAGKVATYLRDGGFQVTEVRNADRSDYFGSMVVARREDVSSAETVARFLGGTPVIRQTSSADGAEVTVVLGSDRSRLRLE